MVGWGEMVAHVLTVWIQPLADAAALVVLWRYVQQVQAERRLHGVKLHPAWMRWVTALALGSVAGVPATAALSALGLPGEGRGVAMAAVATILLGLVRSRWLAFAYGAGLVSALSLAARWVPAAWIPGGAAVHGWSAWAHLDVVSILGTAGVLTLVEGLLIAAAGDLWAIPVELPGRRGRTVGGYLLQPFWVVPVVLTAPVSASAVISWPAAAPNPAGPLAVPAVLGFETAAVARRPRERAVRSAGMLALYGLILLGLSLAARGRPELAWLPALFAPAAREWLSARTLRREWAGSPRFVQGREGVHVMAVVPGTPARAMGLRPGDTVTAVNGRPVHAPEGLYEAVRAQPAFVRLEIRDPAGNVRFCSRSRFEGEPHLLGIIPSPGPEPSNGRRAFDRAGWARAFSILRGRSEAGRAETKGSTPVGGDA